MGSIISSCIERVLSYDEVVLPSPHTTNALKLDSKETALLSMTWKRDDFMWLYEIGTKIYTKVFQLAPELKVFFPYVLQSESSGKDWRESKGFRTQALRFVQIISQAVEKAESSMPDDQSALHRRLYDLGEFHIRFAAKGFKAKHWQGFCIAVRETMEEETKNMPNLTAQEKQKASASWEKLSKYIVHRMEDGYFGRKR